MSPGAANEVVFVTGRKDERLQLCVESFVYEECRSLELNLPGKDVINGTLIGCDVAINVVPSARFPLQQPVEGAVVPEIEILLEIDGTGVALQTATRSRDPPLGVELELVCLGIAIAGPCTLQGPKAKKQKER